MIQGSQHCFTKSFFCWLHQVRLLSFLYFFHIMEQYVHILSTGTHLCILVDTSCMPIMYVLNVTICLNELVFASTYSVLKFSVSRGYHHHHVVLLARISLTLSRHFFLSFIASGRSSGLHPVSSHSCCMYVQAGCPAFARPYVGVHRSTSLMSSSLLLQQCPACLVRLTWIGGRWPYSWCLVGCRCQVLFNIARSLLV